MSVSLIDVFIMSSQNVAIEVAGESVWRAPAGS